MKKQLKTLFNKLNKEELSLLVQGYDYHVLNCERKSMRPLSFVNYEKSCEYKELIDTGNIYNVLEYDSDLEDATLEELQTLACEFSKRIEAVSDDSTVKHFEKLDLLIYELNVGNFLTEEDKKRGYKFYEDLALYGYLPNDKGELILAKSEESHNNDFIWHDYQMALNLLQKHGDDVYVATQIDGDGRYLIASDGWHYVNRLGYYLTSKRIIEKGGEVIL